MRKTILYVVILLLLGFGIYYFIIGNNDNPYKSSEAGFTVKDTASIGKLYLVSNAGESILVERTDSGWIVNGHYKALRSTLNLILATLNRQTALSPVTKAAYDNVIKSLSADAIKVEVYGRDGKKIKAFYVGGNSVNNLGTNMLLEGAHTPYVVQEPGFNGYLTARYTTRMTDWRDRTVFNIPADEIKSISVKYPGDKAINSFEMDRVNGKMVVKGDPQITSLDTQNTRRANLFLTYFGNVNCEGYLNGLSDLDTAIRTAPLQSSIDLTGMHGQHQHVDIYWMALNHRSKNIDVAAPDVPDDYDADRLYAVINNNKDTVMVQHFVFGKIFRKCFEFFQKDPVPGAKPNPKELPANMLSTKKG